MTEGREEEEWRKRITARLCTGPEIVWIDNVRRQLDASSLASALTSRSWSDRRLGATEMVTVPIRCAWVAAGNNPALSSEIARRTVSIRLDAKVDQPWARETGEFKHPRLTQWAAENRAALVEAALTLIRAWDSAGRPAGAETLGSYEAWAATMGGILGAVGVPGFLGNRERFYTRADREAEAWRGFVEAWWTRFQTREVGVKELWNLVAPEHGEAACPDPPCWLGSGSERSQKTRLGEAVASAVDRRFTVGGIPLKIEAAGKIQGARRYRLAAPAPHRGEETPDA